MVPAIPAEERALVSKAELTTRIIKVVAPPVGLVGAVLGSIIAGIAAPSEAASMGALGSIVITGITGRLSLAGAARDRQATVKITAMMMFILICAQVFSLAFRGLQGEKLVQDFFAFLPGGIKADIWFLMFIIFVLGFFIEWIEISYIAVPLFLPVFMAAKVDMVWLATLDLREPADLVPDAAVRLGAVLPARGGAAGDHHRRHLSRRHARSSGCRCWRWCWCSAFPGLATWLPKAIGW